MPGLNNKEGYTMNSITICFTCSLYTFESTDILLVAKALKIFGLSMEEINEILIRSAEFMLSDSLSLTFCPSNGMTSCSISLNK